MILVKKGLYINAALVGFAVLSKSTAEMMFKAVSIYRVLL
jgi:hypothetical protein